LAYMFNPPLQSLMMRLFVTKAEGEA